MASGLGGSVGHRPAEPCELLAEQDPVTVPTSVDGDQGAGGEESAVVEPSIELRLRDGGHVGFPQQGEQPVPFPRGAVRGWRGAQVRGEVEAVEDRLGVAAAYSWWISEQSRPEASV